MRKEDLMKKKEREAQGMVWYLRDIMQVDDLKMFSIAQLQKICDIAQRAENMRERCSPFYTLSATEVIQKESGRIAEFCDNGIFEESENEIMSGAAAQIYKSYKNNLPK